MSVGIWRANGNPSPCTNLNEILQAHPTRFWCKFEPLPLPNWARGPETLKAERHIYENKSFPWVAN